MIKRFSFTILAVVAILAGAVACQRRPLEDPSEVVSIRIRVDVKAVTNVNTNTRNSVKLYNQNTTLWEPKLKQLDPEMMRVLVYDPETDNLLTQSFISYATKDESGEKVFAGNLGISHGNFNFLVYNFDTPTTQVSNENNEEQILAFTDELSPAQKAHYITQDKGKAGEEGYDSFQDISIRLEPEHLLVANERNVRISPHDSVVVVQTEANTVVDTYYIQIRVTGLQFASNATAVITGLSPSNHIGLNERTVEPSTAVVFDLQKGYDESLAGQNKDVLCAVFNTFGKIEEASSNLRVTFNVIDTAGNLLQHDVDMNHIFKTEDAIERHWLIIDEVWDIPDPQPNPSEQAGGGFQPQVDDWEEEHGEIIL